MINKNSYMNYLEKRKSEISIRLDELESSLSASHKDYSLLRGELDYLDIMLDESPSLEHSVTFMIEYGHLEKEATDLMISIKKERVEYEELESRLESVSNFQSALENDDWGVMLDKGDQFDFKEDVDDDYSLNFNSPELKVKEPELVLKEEIEEPTTDELEDIDSKYEEELENESIHDDYQDPPEIHDIKLENTNFFIPKEESQQQEELLEVKSEEDNLDFKVPETEEELDLMVEDVVLKEREKEIESSNNVVLDGWLLSDGKFVETDKSYSETLHKILNDAGMTTKNIKWIIRLVKFADKQMIVDTMNREGFTQNQIDWLEENVDLLTEDQAKTYEEILNREPRRNKRKVKIHESSFSNDIEEVIKLEEE